VDKVTNNVLCAVYLEQRIQELIKHSKNQQAWIEVDKSKLPRSCFLWTESSNKKNTWHLPYREGAGGIDPDTGLYRSAGAVNLGALRAIAVVITATTIEGKMQMPSEIKSKIKKLLQAYNIGTYSKKKQENKVKDIEIREAIIDSQFIESNLNKEARTISNVAILHPTSGNSYIRGTIGTEFSEQALNDVARLITGNKFYIDHPGEQEDKDNRGIRRIRDLAGYFENGRLDENKVVRADIHYLKAHSEFLEDLVDNMADKIGLSIHAFGPMSVNRDRNVGIAESMARVVSADLVTETGSTINLFESKHTEELEEEPEMEYGKINLTELKEARPDIIEAVQNEVKESMQSNDEQKALEETNATLKTENADLKKKVDEGEVVEAARKRETQILELIEASKLKDKKDVVTPRFMESLREAKDEADIKALIEDRVKLIEQSVSGVKNMGDEKNLDDDEKTQTKEMIEAKEKEYEEALA